MKESKEPKIEKELRLDQLIGGIVPNLIAFGLFLEAIGYFASTGQMAEIFGWKNMINRYRSYSWSWKKVVGIYGVSPTTARRWSVK